MKAHSHYPAGTASLLRYPRQDGKPRQRATTAPAQTPAASTLERQVWAGGRCTWGGAQHRGQPAPKARVVPSTTDQGLATAGRAKRPPEERWPRNPRTCLATGTCKSTAHQRNTPITSLAAASPGRAAQDEARGSAWEPVGLTGRSPSEQSDFKGETPPLGRQVGWASWAGTNANSIQVSSQEACSKRKEDTRERYSPNGNF